MSDVRTAALARVSPAVTGLALGALALGPGLGRGFLLSYDMVFVPRLPLTAAALGMASGAPRAVPSDAVVAVFSHILPADLVQKIVLLSVFTLACSGAAALLRGFPLPARLAAGVFYTWNPYVGERLILGQWALLLGYAGLPWVVGAIAAGLGGWRGLARMCLALVPAAIGGFSAMCVSGLTAVPAASSSPALAQSRPAGRARTVVTVLLVLAVASLPWLVPALTRPIHTSAAGVGAFAARADTPFGSFGSLVLLGGTWNAQTVPTGYGGRAAALWLILALVGVGGYIARCRGNPRWPGLGIAALAGLAVAGIGVTAAGRQALSGLIGIWPGFAVLRDGQQFVAPLALAEATGIGAMVAWGVSARQPFRPSCPGGATPAGSPPRRWLPHSRQPFRICAGPGGATPPGSPPRRWLPHSRQPFRITGETSSRRGRTDLPGAVVAIAALVAPLVLMPGLAWGADGRLRPVSYPADWLRARAMINASPAHGSALLLPWAAYRRYTWNHGEAVLDPWPRLLARTVIWNDTVQVGNLVVPGEDPTARGLGHLITSGASLTVPLGAAGVRFVIVDGGPDGPAGTAAGRPQPAGALTRRLAGAAVVLAGPDVVVYELSGG